MKEARDKLYFKTAAPAKQKGHTGKNREKENRCSAYKFIHE
jgi:hypothetical protein